MTLKTTNWHEVANHAFVLLRRESFARHCENFHVPDVSNCGAGLSQERAKTATVRASQILTG